MRLTKYISISLVFVILCLTETRACWTPTYTPGEYYMFRLYYEQEYLSQQERQYEQNNKEWHLYTHKEANMKDIDTVVYQYSIQEMERLLALMDKGNYKISDSNTFIQYLFKTHDRDAIALLLLAKECAYHREKRNDPWWYPTKGDLQYGDLKRILNQALAYKSGKLEIRYLLQALRAAATMQNDSICMELWETKIKNSPNSVIKQMCESYVAGVFFRRAQYEEAARHFISSGDESSFWWCASYLSSKNEDVDRIKMLYTYSPNSPSLPVMVQQIVRRAEIYANLKVFDNDCSRWYLREYYSAFKKNKRMYKELQNLSIKIAREGKTNNPAMWQYTAAFIALLNENYNYSARLVATASDMKGSSMIKDNIKILQLMLDAKLGSYDELFETKIFPQLKWLDNKIATNITDNVMENTIRDRYMMEYNYSYYYYNDMMRKTVLSIIVPNYLKKGDSLKALAFAGMATERLFQLVNKRSGYYSDTCIKTLVEYRRDTTFGSDHYSWEYSNDIFRMLDISHVETVITYRDFLFNKNKSEFDNFLTDRCYKSTDYLNELIGTQYIRRMEFGKAVDFLSLVDAYYENTLNTSKEGSLSDDPFYAPWSMPDRKKINSGGRHKLNFAKKMNQLQTQIGATTNKQKKAQYEYEYAIGLASVISINWALARYGQGYKYGDADKTTFYKKYFNNVRRNLNLAKKHSIDKSLQAQCVFALAWLYYDVNVHYIDNDNITYEPNNKMKLYYALLVKKYSQTDFFKKMQTQCDVLDDYVVNRK